MEEAASPDGKVESWISWELTYKASLGPQDGRSLHSPTRIFKVHGEALRGRVTYLIQMKSTPHSSLKAVSFNMVPAGGMWAQLVFQGQGRGLRSPTSWIQLVGQPGVTSSQPPPKQNGVCFLDFYPNWCNAFLAFYKVARLIHGCIDYNARYQVTCNHEYSA